MASESAVHQPVYVMQCCKHTEGITAEDLGDLLGLDGAVEVLPQDLAVDASCEAVWSPGPYSVPGFQVPDALDGWVLVVGTADGKDGWHRCGESQRLRRWLRSLWRQDGQEVWAYTAMVVPGGEYEWTVVHEEIAAEVADMHGWEMVHE